MPMVVGGFEPVDLLQAILALVTMLEEGRAEFANEYARSVSYRGNPRGATYSFPRSLRLRISPGVASERFRKVVFGCATNSQPGMRTRCSI